jgi:hypothetical protein
MSFFNLRLLLTSFVSSNISHIYEKLEDTKEVIRNHKNKQYNDQTKMEKQYDLQNTAHKTVDKKQI